MLTDLQRLQAAKTRAGLAKILAIEHSYLTYLLYKKNDNVKYKVFNIPKRSGGTRIISAPEDELKSLQSRLSNILNQCILDIEAAGGRTNSAAHGFRPNKSILTNAGIHKNKRFVFNIDLKDFFPTITAKRIRGFLINDKHFNLSPEVATAIAHIACHNDCLPQGAPSSPVLSNLIAGILDFHLTRLAKNCGCRYTRYADDITFSTNKKDFPKEISESTPTNNHQWLPGKKLEKIISKSGFSINPEKTRMQYRCSRQQVTGLIVNKKVNVSSDYRKLIRAYVFSLINHGKYTTTKIKKNDEGEVVKTPEEGTHAQLHGMLGFIHAVDNIARSNSKNNPQNHLEFAHRDGKSDKKLQIFRRFLFFTKFYANTAPLIICEGKTDNVYISNAVHNSKALFPQLLRKSEDGKDILSFHFMRYHRQHKKSKSIYLPNFSTVSILGAGSGGVDNLNNMIAGYKAEHRRFRAKSGDHPVIFIVDNDSAGKKVYSTAVKNSYPKIDKITGDEPFINIFANLYLVPIPKVAKPETNIEDLFFPKDIPTHINGKKLIFSNDNDSSLAGKADFAFNYVEKNAESIDWSGFHPLLRNICQAINDHSLKTPVVA